MNLLITGAWQCTEKQLHTLRAMGHDVLFLQQEKDSLPCPYEWVEGVVCNGLFLSHPIEKFTNLRFIQLTSAGYDRVPLEYIKENNIEIYNARGVYSVPMAEFALCGVLQLYKQSRFFYNNQKKHQWEKHRGLPELSGKTVLVVGCGDVGTECAKRFDAFGCRVLGVNRTPKEAPCFEQVFGLEELDRLLPIADIIVLTVSLTPQTRHLFNAERLDRLKDTAVLVNISRGAVIDQEALTERIGRIAGAVLDVFEEEPLPEDSPLWDRENVIITPHNSFAGDGNAERLRNLILSSIERTRS